MLKILIALVLLSFPLLSSAEVFTIYLVRHAEKQSSKDPQLTQCGQQRAKQLAKMLSSESLTRVYSTQTKRTLATAAPTAKAKNIEISNYNPKALDEITLQLINAKESALVVGHSNTTSVVAGKLVNQDLALIDESEYSLLYQVIIDTDKNYQQNKLTILHQPLTCSGEK